MSYLMTSHDKPFGKPKTHAEAEQAYESNKHIIKGLGYMPINQKPLTQDQRDSIARLEAEARKAKEEE